MKTFDDNLQDILKYDTLDFTTDPSVKLRLLNYMQIKSAFSLIKRNQFFPALKLSWFFRFPLLKAGIVSIVFIFFMMNYKSNNYPGISQNNDTIACSESYDSLEINNSLSDTINF